MFLIYDTETTGLPRNFNAPYTDLGNWPRLVQIAWQVHDHQGKLLRVENHIVRPDGFTIPFESEKVHGISTELALEHGKPLEEVLNKFEADVASAEFVSGHNLSFDNNIMGAEFIRGKVETKLHDLPVLDTKDLSTDYCAIPGGRGGKYKWPTLTELHQKLFGEGFDAAHNAAADVEATARCFLELIRIGVINANHLNRGPEFTQAFKEANPQPIQAIGLNVQPFPGADKKKKDDAGLKVPKVATSDLTDAPYAHLHNHSQYSILQATTPVADLIKAAGKAGMPAVAMTDLGNMMGAFHFVSAAQAYNKKAEHKVKPILGCELHICKDRKNKSVKDNGFQQVFLAKTKKGYHNLAKLSSAGFIEGYYYVPRIDKEILLEFKSDLIALTGGLTGEIPYLILNVGEHQAEEAFLWWKKEFGDDFYVELNRHGLPEEDKVNEVLLKFCEKHDVKYLAANNSYYLEKADADAHDVLLCVKEGEKRSTPIGKGRGFRYGFPNHEFYFKGQDEMKQIFADLPKSVETISEVIDKIESYTLARDVLLPKFDIPSEFLDPKDQDDGGNRGENAYLKHLTFKGAEGRYKDLTDEIVDRLNFELETIEKTGYPGYFLIVQDFIAEARKMGVSVGPGRGSAAGSAVAYCLGITNIDPIKYDLLFERFLNPERVSMPDIDIDFDDRGRGKVIDWVVNKYGSNQVAQIITYGTMAAKSSIRDCGRVLELPLPDTDRIAKLVPDMKLGKLFGLDEKTLKDKAGERYSEAKELIALADVENLEGEVVNKARVLEGSVRNTGIHACGVIITPSDIREHLPVAVSKDSDLWCTQFDNSVVESAGLLKMDFLGLKNLTIIADAIEIIKQRHGIEIDPDAIPLDDEKTYELFQKGLTVAIFQYESVGMQKYLKELKPDKFEDLIAMNALYRPGPLAYIPDFVKRKHGEQEIEYDLPAMEPFLKDTYGITVYQEQVMLLSQELAGFTKGQADSLRKAMGKKKKEVLDEMYPKFVEGCVERGHPEDKVAKIWKDWEAFASYAFNKSHSTCYAYVAFQTAYLKANYTAEYMAAVLTNNMNDIKEVTKFMEECRNLRLEIFGPDVNESMYKFAVNQQGQIRFGLGAIKGVGQGAVEAIVNERNENGRFLDFFDFCKRVDLRAVNKKTMESLAMAGAFDEFPGHHRGLFFHADSSGVTFLEKATKFGSAYQESLNAPPDLFGDSGTEEIPNPEIPIAPEWDRLYALAKEKEVVGVYISGHPLDAYKFHIRHFCNASLSVFKKPEAELEGKKFNIAGVLTEHLQRIDKRGNPFGRFTLEDFEDSHTFMAFREDYGKIKDFLIPGAFLYATVHVVRNQYRDNLDFKFAQVMMLSEVLENCPKKLETGMPLSQLNTDGVARLEEVFNRYPGSKPLEMGLWTKNEAGEQVSLRMQSGKVRVRICEELVQELSNLNCKYFRFN